MRKLLLTFLLFPVFAFGQGTMDFDFEGLELPTAYSDGSFDYEGVTFTYAHCRDQDEFPILDQGLMLRKPASSYFEWTVTNGVGTLSFEFRKAFTGGSIRQLEIIANGVQVGLTNEFGEGTGEQSDVYTFSQGINLDGEVTIRIKNVGDVDANRQSIIDNIVWTAFGEDPIECLAPSSIVAEVLSDSEANISWIAEGENQTFELSYGLEGFSVEEGTIVTATSPFALEGLIEATSYDVYVRAICEDETKSDWTGPVNFTTSPGVGLSTDVFKELSFYPNPVSETLNLKVDAKIEKVEFINVLGESVKTVTPNAMNTKINVSSLNKGVYFIKVTVKGNEKTYRLIKK